MALVRAILTMIIAASLAALPARVGATGSVGTAARIVSATADCASMDDGACQSASGASEGAGNMVPMSDECDRSGGHGTMSPGACSAYCNNLSALPTILSIGIDIVFISAFRPVAGPVMDGIGVSPEPRPPKLV
jgi:hypothetical protein